MIETREKLDLIHEILLIVKNVRKIILLKKPYFFYWINLRL